MKKAVIIYGSTHHQNTFKLVNAIANKHKLATLDATNDTYADLSGYDLIGFASGIDFGKFYSIVEDFLKRNLPHGKKVFFMYTCAKPDSRFTQSIKAEAIKKGAVILGEYGCKGYNTYGPLKLIGGMNKKHPDKNDIDSALLFYESVIEKCKP